MVRSCPQLSSLAVGIHSPVDGRLGRFQGLAIMNKAVMNILVRGFCGPMFSFLLEKHLRVEMLGHRVHVCLTFVCFFFVFFLRFYLFNSRERGREGEKGRETSMCGYLLRAPYWGPGPQPRHVPSLGIEPATLWCAGPRSIH